MNGTAAPQVETAVACHEAQHRNAGGIGSSSGYCSTRKLTPRQRCVTLGHMKTVTIRELHARTGELVRQAKEYGQIFVTDNSRIVAKIVPEYDTNERPYFARRAPSAAFRRLDRSGKTGGGMDATRSISEDRDDRA